MSAAGPSHRSLLAAWKPLAGRALEAALNRALALDPDTRAQLTALDGRAVVLRLQSSASDTAPLALQLRVQRERLQVGAVPEDTTPDLAVRSTLAALLAQLPALFGSEPSRAGVAPGRLLIEGDAELARSLQRLAQRFDPDWELPFAAVFGDVIGVQLAQLARNVLLQGRAFAGGLARNSAEYLTEESRDIVSRDEIHAFLDDVDALREDAERLLARAQAFERDLQPSSP